MITQNAALVLENVQQLRKLNYEQDILIANKNDKNCRDSLKELNESNLA